MLTQQRAAMQAALAQHHLTQRSRIFAVSHNDMPKWVGHLDWGLQLMGTSHAKAASMPTKFAEFIASGVRPIHHGCNVEVGRWVEACGTGINLPDLRNQTLDKCAADVIARGPSRSDRKAARNTLEQHFSLTNAAKRYDRLLAVLMSPTKAQNIAQ